MIPWKLIINCHYLAVLEGKINPTLRLKLFSKFTKLSLTVTVSRYWNCTELVVKDMSCWVKEQCLDFSELTHLLITMWYFLMSEKTISLLPADLHVLNGAFFLTPACVLLFETQGIFWIHWQFGIYVYKEKGG